MLNRLTMNRKLLVTLLPLAIVILVVILLFIRSAVLNSVSDTAKQTAHGLVQADGELLLDEVLRNIGEVNSLAAVLQSIEHVNQFERRDFIKALLHAYVQDNDNLLGAWSGWEADALDGLDELYQNSDGHDSTGRFIPYWYRENQDIKLTHLLDYTDAEKGAYYQRVKRTGKPIVLDRLSTQSAIKWY